MTRSFTRRTLMRAAAVGAIAAAVGPQLPTLARETDEISLLARWNGHTWCGPDTPIHEAVGSLPLKIAHGWDIESQRWTSYAPNTPVNTIGVLRHGQPLLMLLNSDAIWRQPGFRGPLPEPTELPVGWSFVGWSGLHEPVWTALGTEPFGPVAEALRWNSEYRQWISYEPGESAQQLFAVLHPGDAVWLRMRVAGARWNPAAGIVPADLASRVVPGEITYYHPSLAGGPMFCPPHNRYDPSDPAIAAAVTWPCGTRLRIWRDERYVDVIIQDTGLLGHNHVDLSEAAFQRLAILPEGRVSVLIEVLAGPE